ncbi:hypothetical protein IFM89_027460 [Coptis chinensis]|uniref:RNase H type-1 domain-containing protein n=1 Tax=Coptis chinensis TaxID=261450 RepID=A0A835IY42_9MAGN|nr:hypothetical protein IFM89_027460 [Coptis chinensis]
MLQTTNMSIVTPSIQQHDRYAPTGSPNININSGLLGMTTGTVALDYGLLGADTTIIPNNYTMGTTSNITGQAYYYHQFVGEMLMRSMHKRHKSDISNVLPGLEEVSTTLSSEFLVRMNTAIRQGNTKAMWIRDDTYPKVKVLKAKYFPNVDALHSNSKQGSSWLWKSVTTGLHLVKKNSIWRVAGTWTRHATTAEEVECRGVLLATQWALERQLTHLELEIDAQAITVEWATRSSNLSWRSKDIIRDIRSLASNFIERKIPRGNWLCYIAMHTHGTGQLYCGALPETLPFRLFPRAELFDDLTTCLMSIGPQSLYSWTEIHN